MKRSFRGAFLAPSIIFVFFLVMCSGLFSCKSKPTPVLPDGAEPHAGLIFERVEAKDPEHLDLLFSLKINNPLPLAGQAAIKSWRAEINGREAPAGFSLEKGQTAAFPVGEGSASFPLWLGMDIAALASLGLAPEDDYQVMLALELGLLTDGGLPLDSCSAPVVHVSAIALFPGIRPPVFSITSIAILKAELINTRFRVGLKIENPNPYPVELSSFGYELYGNGLLWADGMETNVFRINGKSTLSGNLFLLMNFINMKRDLLDQIINLEDVNYRFAGEAQVGTGVEYLPSFRSGFDLSGYSEVLEN